MIVKTRKSAQGTEYWDTEEKRTRFVPKGKKPNFEVTEETKAMLSEKKYLGEFVKSNAEINLDEMNKEHLLSFAEKNNIDIPGNVSKEETIRKHIEESLTADDE
ncbi:hypothetical protein ACTWP4_00330 [Gracilibacillus sp. D59]|uniref:hypothetical protein n=1 Tax=Gracilibacillus sp. D59 TaxID=3457434 RepID=UPI003FCDA635